MLTTADWVCPFFLARTPGREVLPAGVLVCRSSLSKNGYSQTHPAGMVAGGAGVL